MVHDGLLCVGGECSPLVLAYLVCGLTGYMFLRSVWSCMLLVFLWVICSVIIHSVGTFGASLLIVCYSVVGILLGVQFSMQSLATSFMSSRKHTWRYIGQCFVLGLCFIGVGEKIRETGFPVGVVKSFLLWNGVAFVVYYWNRFSVRHSVRVAYDDANLQWILSCNVLFVLHSWMYTHPWIVGLVSAFFLSVSYFVSYFVWWRYLDRYDTGDKTRGMAGKRDLGDAHGTKFGPRRSLRSVRSANGVTGVNGVRAVRDDNLRHVVTSSGNVYNY